jgi:hypothetical protein
MHERRVCDDDRISSPERRIDHEAAYDLSSIRML